MWLDVNGEKRQRGNTKTMIFDCRHIVWYCSQYFVHGAGRRHHHRHAARRRARHEAEPKFLKAGDVVTLGIDGLGEQRQKVVKFKKCAPISRPVSPGAAQRRRRRLRWCAQIREPPRSSVLAAVRDQWCTVAP